MGEPCAACKYLRRRCLPTCVFAPYFPPDKPERFLCVQQVFGASNVSDILNDLDPVHRRQAVDSLLYEAELRLQDPIYGCVGIIFQLEARLRDVRQKIHDAKSELNSLNVANHSVDRNPARHSRGAATQPRQATDLMRNPGPSTASSSAPQTVEAQQPLIFLSGLDTQEQTQVLHLMGNGAGSSSNYGVQDEDNSRIQELRWLR